MFIRFFSFCKVNTTRLPYGIIVIRIIYFVINEDEEYFSNGAYK